jgi:hypothetical protein
MRDRPLICQFWRILSWAQGPRNRALVATHGGLFLSFPTKPVGLETRIPWLWYSKMGLGSISIPPPSIVRTRCLLRVQSILSFESTGSMQHDRFHPVQAADEETFAVMQLSNSHVTSPSSHSIVLWLVSGPRRPSLGAAAGCSSTALSMIRSEPDNHVGIRFEIAVVCSTVQRSMRRMSSQRVIITPREYTALQGRIRSSPI